MVLCAILFWITLMTMHRFIMKYPQVTSNSKKFLAHNDILTLTTTDPGYLRIRILRLWQVLDSV
jgi:hypothetical protein